jgi:hypothetical protein
MVRGGTEATFTPIGIEGFFGDACVQLANDEPGTSWANSGPPSLERPNGN